MTIYKALMEEARWGAASQAINRVPLGMVELLTLRADCSLVARKSDRSSRLLPASQIPELRRFAKGLLEDKSAVVAGLTLSVSQWASRGSGPEARNLVKRSMFGRAKLPLLRQRLLNAA
jgi:hypothetical protein